MAFVVTSAGGVNGNGYGAFLAFGANGSALSLCLAGWWMTQTSVRSIWRSRQMAVSSYPASNRSAFPTP